MAPIVFVHGINQVGRSRVDLESEWCAALATGLDRAGHADLAAAVRAGEPAAAAAMCCYAPPPPDQQGMGLPDPDDLGPADLDLADELALAWLRQATRSPIEKDAQEAEHALHLLGMPDGEEQGVRTAVVRAAGLLDRLPYFNSNHRLVTALGVRLVPALAEVISYLNDETVRGRAIARGRELIAADTRVVIGHSLGSVVAYEALGGSPRRIRLLVTVGSPLGMQLVRARLRQRPAWPTSVARWLNLASPADIVAARPDLGPDYGWDMPPGARLDQRWDVDNTFRPHRVGFYLEQPECGAAVAAALTGGPPVEAGAEPADR